MKEEINDGKWQSMGVLAPCLHTLDDVAHPPNFKSGFFLAHVSATPSKGTIPQPFLGEK